MEMTNDQAAMSKEAMNVDAPLGMKSFVIDWSLRLGHWSLLLLAVGCSSSGPTTKPATIRDRQDAALKDPFGYSVDVKDEHDISGGGLFELDKDGFKKDVNHALNP